MNTHIKHTLYINLEHRTDRKENVELQLKSVGLTDFERFNAIKNNNGAIGCSMSHLQCLLTAKERNYEHIFICEDDITFLNPTLIINQINNFFLNHQEWDVLLVGGNNFLPYTTIDNNCIKVNNCQCATGYIVKNHYFDTLIDNFKTGLLGLIKEPNKHIIFALDQYWKSLQKKDNWFLIIPLSVVQKEDYSDIEKKMVNYRNGMLCINK
jgi:glycosyl transferase family 25